MCYATVGGIGNAMPQELIKVHLTRNIEHIDGLHTYVPSEAIVVTPHGFDTLRILEQTHGLRLVHDHRPYPYVKRWTPDKTPAPANVAYFQDGAMGDELVHSTFLWQLRYDYPATHITTYTQGQNHYMAHNAGRVQQARLGWRIPEIEHYDAWLTPTPMSMQERGSDTSVYDLYAAELGITPRYARPYVTLSPEEIEEVWRHLNVLPSEFRDNFILIQYAASEALRTPDGWHMRLRALVDDLRGVARTPYIACVGDVNTVGITRLRSGLVQYPRLVDFPYGGPVASLSPRTILYLASIARVVITPDSMLLHAAAAFNRPCVALWNMGNGASRADAPDHVPPAADPMTRAKLLARERNPYLSHVSAVPGERPQDRVPTPQSRTATYPNTTIIDMADHPSVMTDAIAGILSQ